MATKTSIEWTDATWPVITGCRRCSPGCQNCYAERLTGTRLRNNRKYVGLTNTTHNGPLFNGEVRIDTQGLDMPLHWRRPRRIFVCDMSDLFYEAVPDDWIRMVFRTMAQSRQHTFQILTKRGSRQRSFVAGTHPLRDIESRQWPLPHVWLGVSVEDREHGLPRIDELRRTPAALRFVSFEPLLEDLGEMDLSGVNWAIIGGESGPNARSCHIGWMERIISQCRSRNIPVFVKQLGSFSTYGCGNWPRFLHNSKGADPAEWPEHLRIKEFPK